MDLSAVDERAALGLLGSRPFFLHDNDQLRLTAFNAAASVVLTVRGRLMTAAGEDVPFQRELTPATDRSASTLTFSPGKGWLLECQVFASTGAPLIGQTFAIVSLVRGRGATVVDVATVAAGYVTALQRLAYPGSPIQTSLDGAGALRLVAGTAPAAGAEIAETVPTGARWEFLSLFTTFVTDANAANRFPTLTLDDGTNVYFRQGSGVVQTATVTIRRNWMQAVNLTTADNSNNLAITLPRGLHLRAAHVIRTVTNNIQVGDQYSAPQMLVREWIEGA
jgi:hypothetical protein